MNLSKTRGQIVPQIEVEDNVKFTSLVENDIPLRDWKLIYEDEHRNQRFH